MNEKLSRLKEQYEEIQAPDSLREKSQKIVEEWTPENNGNGVRRKAVWKRWAAAAAAVAIAFLGGLNVSESFAATVASLPGMDGVVRVLTMDRYRFEEGTMEADIVTPQIEGLADQKVQDMINEQLRKDAEDAIALFEADKEALEEAGLAEDAHMGWEFNYQVRTDTDDLLVVDTYLYNVVGSSSTIHKYYNVDKKNGKLLTLPEVMADHPAYVEELSEYILGEMKRANDSGEGMFFIDPDDTFGEDAFTQIAEDQLFYLNENGQLVICFDKYQVAPGSEGSPEFVIPADYFQWDGVK